MQKCYGASDPEKTKCVKQIFTDMGLPGAYSIYEKETYNLLNAKIQQISYGSLHDMFHGLLEKLYHRVR